MAKFLNRVQNQKALYSYKNPLELVRKRHNFPAREVFERLSAWQSERDS